MCDGPLASKLNCDRGKADLKRFESKHHSCKLYFTDETYFIL